MKCFTLCRHTELVSVSNHKTGFTLMELLVVVLIIGVLAGVAVAQYQTTVDKARFSKYITVADGIKRAQEIYYMANGEYAVDVRDLDIDYLADCIRANRNEWRCGTDFLINNGWKNGALARVVQVHWCPKNNRDWNQCYPAEYAHFTVGYDFGTGEYDGRRDCSYPAGSKRGERLCKSLGIGFLSF